MKPFEVVSGEEEDLAVLKVRPRRLELPMRENFVAATAELLERPEARLAVDISNLSRIYSLFIGALVELDLRAKQAGKSLTLIVSAGVAGQLRKMSLDQNMNIQEAR